MRLAQAVRVGKCRPSDRPLLWIFEKTSSEVVTTGRCRSYRHRVLSLEPVDEAGQEAQGIALQEGAEALERCSGVRADGLAAEEKVIGGRGRTAGRERLGEALECLFALLELGAEFEQCVHHAEDVQRHGGRIGEPVRAQW